MRDLLEARSGVYYPTVYEKKGIKGRSSHRAAPMPQAHSGTTTTGISMRWATSMKKPRARRSPMRSTGKSPSLIGHAGFSLRATDSTSAARETRYPAVPFRHERQGSCPFRPAFPARGQWVIYRIGPRRLGESEHPAVLRYVGRAATAICGGPATRPAAHGQKLNFPRRLVWAEGNLGQYAVVIPSLDLIVVNRVDGKLTKRTVSKQQMAHFAQMVIEAAPR